MACCGRSQQNQRPTQYKVTWPDGETKTFKNLIEAQMARAKKPGGSISTTRDTK